MLQTGTSFPYLGPCSAVAMNSSPTAPMGPLPPHPFGAPVKGCSLAMLFVSPQQSESLHLLPSCGPVPLLWPSSPLPCSVSFTLSDWEVPEGRLPMLPAPCPAHTASSHTGHYACSAYDWHDRDAVGPLRSEGPVCRHSGRSSSKVTSVLIAFFHQI